MNLLKNCVYLFRRLQPIYGPTDLKTEHKQMYVYASRYFTPVLQTKNFKHTNKQETRRN